MKKRLIRSATAVALAAGLMAAHTGWTETVQVTNNISGSTAWRGTNTYVLNGFTYVLPGGQLQIEPGTVIKGKPGADANTSCLLVCRGAKIFANGTRTHPIIFTAEADDVLDPDDIPIYQRGLWGGVVVLGQARLNTVVDTGGSAANPKYEVFEGMPDAQIGGVFVNRFGGNDDDDSSGVLRYVSIRHAGVVFQPNKELNALSLGAVGRGTVIEYVEAYASADDGFEFFGGTVNTKYLVSAFNDDDAFDIDQGYRGKNQFWLAIQEPGKKDNGGEWNGEPNGLAVGASPVANYQIYNATFIGAGTNTTGNRGLFVREYAAPKVYNSIFTEFGGPAVRLDGKSAEHLAGGLLDFQNNIFWNFATNGVPVGLAEGPEAAPLFSETSRDNVQVDPQFHGISRTANGQLDPRPAAGSPALSSPRTAPDDGFYTPVAYKGAFDAHDLWLNDWTFLSYKMVTPLRAEHVVQVTQDISGQVHWYCTNEYVLNGMRYVLPGGELRIEPGTVIKGKPGTDANTSCLIVSRGAKIFAEGTPNNPIIFTAEADDIYDPTDISIYQRGLWGGVVLLGQARLNTVVDTGGSAANPKYEVFEGMPDAQIGGVFVNRFGGNDDDDSSGVLRYVSLRHCGVVFQPNKELNGLSLGAVGRGTVIEYVEAYAAADDGFEFFGGTVNTKYLVSAFNDDDAFDIDQGYRGKNQFWLAIQEPGKKDNGGEWNGEPNGLAVGASPVANYQIYNATFIGAGTNTTGNRGLFVREYAAPRVYNSIFTEFGGPAVRLDSKSAEHLAGGLLDFQNNIFWNFATNGVPVALAEGPEAAPLFSETSRDNVRVDPQLQGISRSANGRLDPRPAAGSPALNSPRTPPSDGFYSPVQFKGAFAGVNWATDWTALGEYGIITAVGAGVPRTIVPVGPVAVSLAIARDGANVTIAFDSLPGTNYQIQSCSSLPAAPQEWINVGAVLAGTGNQLTRSAPVSGGNQFFRVVSQ